MSQYPKPLRPSPGRRWHHWQTSLIAQAYLTPEAARLGYTLLRVPLQEREAFFDLVSLLFAHGRCLAQQPRLLDDLGTAPRVEEAQTTWTAWRVWTRRLTAYLERLAQGKEGTCPSVPEEFQGLLEVMEKE